MKKNDIVRVKIEDIGIDGEGIGRADGLTLFIKDAIVGDEVTAKVMKLKKNYGYAKLIDVEKPSEFRVDAPCPYAKACGGCQIMELSYEKQLEFKESKLRGNLKRIGGFEEEVLNRVIEPIVGMTLEEESTFRYRNKAQFPVGTDKSGNVIAGFYASRTHSIISNEDCLLVPEVNKRIVMSLLAFMERYHITAYNEQTREGLVRHVLIRTGKDSGQIMVCVVINGSTMPEEDELISGLSSIEGMHSISLNYNTENTNVILGKTTRTIWGEDTIEDSIHLRDVFTMRRHGADGKEDIKTAFRISPQSFYQVNPVQTEKLYSLALEYAGLTGGETVWDLYCGIGTISLFLAGSAGKVYGVEIVERAVDNARENAIRNGIDNTMFYTGAAEKVIPEWLEEQKKRPDVVVVDPPRKGLDPICVNTILTAGPKRLVYVSCDSATLARDLKMFAEGGYELAKVRPVDQFPHTTHVETVCLLNRK